MSSATWVFAWPIIESDAVIAEKVLLRVADRLDHDRSKFLPTLTENRLASLFLKLHRLFPRESDPPHNSEFSGVSLRQQIGWFRNDVINALEARGTEEACREILRLANSLPKENVWLRWRYYNARVSKRRIAWTPPSPQTVLLLAKRSDRRLVRDAQDLLEVAMESLERFQAQLTQSTLPRSEVLWHWDGDATINAYQTVCHGPHLKSV